MVASEWPIGLDVNTETAFPCTCTTIPLPELQTRSVSGLRDRIALESCGI